VIEVATLQVKGIDEDLYRALGARAKRDNRSISQQVVKLIQDSLARSSGSAEDATRAFLALCGSWKDDRSAREIAASIRKSRRSGRRFKGGGDVFA
jgi:plasmid stability protein